MDVRSMASASREKLEFAKKYVQQRMYSSNGKLLNKRLREYIIVTNFLKGAK